MPRRERQSHLMQSAEEFMREYFTERVIEEQRWQANRTPFRQKFYAGDCLFDSHAGTLEMMRAETVLSLSSTDGEAEVITSRVWPGVPGSLHKFRYHLLASGETWLIREVDLWCAVCHGEAGSSTCRFCQGTGWSARTFKT